MINSRAKARFHHLPHNRNNFWELDLALLLAAACIQYTDVDSFAYGPTYSTRQQNCRQEFVQLARQVLCTSPAEAAAPVWWRSTAHVNLRSPSCCCITAGRRTRLEQVLVVVLGRCTTVIKGQRGLPWRASLRTIDCLDIF